MTTVQKYVIGLLLFYAGCNGQTVGLTIHLNNKLTGDRFIEKDVTITINDTLVKRLRTNLDGDLKPILLFSGGFYKVAAEMTGYKIFVDKKVGIDEARGRHLVISLKPISDKIKK